MACSKPLNFETVVDITHCNIKLLEFLRENNLIFSFEGPCNVCVNGQLHLRLDSTTREGHTWQCTNRRCTHKVSFHKHSFFAGSHLSLATIAKKNYLLLDISLPQEIVLHKTGH